MNKSSIKGELCENWGGKREPNTEKRQITLTMFEKVMRIYNVYMHILNIYLFMCAHTFII